MVFKGVFPLQLFFQWYLRCLRNSPSWKLLWLYLAVMLQQAWKGGIIGELKWKRNRWVMEHSSAYVGYLLSWCGFFWPVICYVDTTLLTWRTVTWGGPFRKCLLQKCQEQLLCHLCDSGSFPFLQAIVLQTKIETKLMKPSRCVCYLWGKTCIIKNTHEKHEWLSFPLALIMTMCEEDNFFSCAGCRCSFCHVDRMRCYEKFDKK